MWINVHGSCNTKLEWIEYFPTNVRNLDFLMRAIEGWPVVGAFASDSTAHVLWRRTRRHDTPTEIKRTLFLFGFSVALHSNSLDFLLLSVSNICCWPANLNTTPLLQCNLLHHLKGNFISWQQSMPKIWKPCLEAKQILGQCFGIRHCLWDFCSISLQNHVLLLQWLYHLIYVTSVLVWLLLLRTGDMIYLFISTMVNLEEHQSY